MSALTVAKKDFRDAVQSRALWALLALFVVASVLMVYSYVEFPEMAGGTEEATVAGLVFFIGSIVSLFVSVTAIVVCYKAIAGERELGSIKLLLSLPHTRTDVLVGKLLGRAAVLSFALAIGLAIGFAVGFALLGTVEVVPVVLFVLVTLLFTVVYVSIVVSLSASTGSTTRATTLAVGFFLVFELLWDVVPIGTVYVAEGFSLPQQMPDWVFLVTQLQPSAAYFSSLVAVMPELADTVGAGTGAEGADAFYAAPEIGLLALAFWLAVPLAIGYRLFTRADL